MSQVSQFKPVTEYYQSLLHVYTYKQKYQQWVKMLQQVEISKDIATMEYYSKYLELFPFNYQIWNKYAQIIATQYNVNEALKIYQAGIQYNARSLDLWNFYCSWVYHTFQPQTNLPLIENVYESALAEIGLDYNSYITWDAYIQIQTQAKNYQKAHQTFLQVVSKPIKEIENILQRYQDFLSEVPETDLVKFVEQAKITPSGDKKQALIANFDELLRNNLNRKINRQQFEEKLIKAEYDETSESDLEVWLKYIHYIQQFKDTQLTQFTYEKALISQSEDSQLWLNYLEFLETELPQAESTKLISEIFSRLKLFFKYLDINILFYYAESVEKVTPEKSVEIYQELQAEGIIESFFRQIDHETRHANFNNVKAIFEHLFKTYENDEQILTFVIEKYHKFLIQNQKEKENTIHTVYQTYLNQPKFSKYLLQSYLKLFSDPESVFNNILNFGLKKAFEAKKLSECAQFSKSYLRQFYHSLEQIQKMEKKVNKAVLSVNLNIPFSDAESENSLLQKRDIQQLHENQVNGQEDLIKKQKV